jgi:bacterioferritin (cytochrome b1)
MKQTAVLWVMDKLSTLNGLKELNGIDGYEYFHRLKEIEQKGLTMEKQQAHEYAEFAIMCDRKEMKILEFDGFINLE